MSMSVSHIVYTPRRRYFSSSWLMKCNHLVWNVRPRRLQFHQKRSIRRENHQPCNISGEIEIFRVLWPPTNIIVRTSQSGLFVNLHSTQEQTGVVLLCSEEESRGLQTAI